MVARTTKNPTLYRAAVALVCLLAIAVRASNASDAPKIRFGLMNKLANGRYQVYEETTHIPLVLSDPNFRFGFDVEHIQDGKHAGYVVFHYPSTTRTVNTTLGGEETPLSVTPGLANHVLKTTPVEYDRMWWGDFQFDDDSDVGRYRIEIFIDGLLVRTFEFDVERPPT